MQRIAPLGWRSLLAACVLLFAAPAAPQDTAYDPLRVSEAPSLEWLDLLVHDAERRRPIPIRVYRPASPSPAPVLLFSHGLGGSRSGSAYLGKHWSARGYLCVFLQHPGSDASVWENQPPRRRMQALKDAANLENFLLRVKDVPAVLDQLARWNKTQGHPLAGRLDLTRIGMSGHSFGAITAQAVSGQSFRRGRASFTDPRIRAALLLSPSSPRRGDPREAFGSVKIPWLSMTGTKDVALIGDTDVESRLAVFPALPPGGKYELVLEGAEHSAFGDRPLPGDAEARNPKHHRAILALSTAFWDAELRRDAAARAWLQGGGPRSVLEKGDRWQMK